MRVLFSWIGFRDLCYIANRLKQEDAHKHISFIKELDDTRESPPKIFRDTKYSPISYIIYQYKHKNEPIEQLILFCDLDKRNLKEIIKKFWDKEVQNIKIIDVSPKNVHSYSDVLSSAAKQWPRKEIADNIEPYFNLSSGTTAMRAFLLLAGQVHYTQSAKFIEVEVNESNKIEARISPIDLDFASFAVNATFQKIENSTFSPITGSSSSIEIVKKQAIKAAQTDLNVLLYGETGTGKELFAKAIHDAGNRRDKKFLAVNCAGLPPNLAESLLFGCIKGAYSGADKDKKGVFKDLDGGTLFIDELEACPPEVQAKLLRVLQAPEGQKITCRRFIPLGDNKEQESDVRIIAATNERLEENDFRADLLNRVAQLSINLPPLRERKGDIEILTQELLKNIKEILGKEFSHKTLSKSAIKFIESRAWFGNIRELKNALTQAIVFSENDLITEADFDKKLPVLFETTPNESDEVKLTPNFNFKEFIKKKERELQQKYVGKAMQQAGGNKTKAAELLGITYQTIDNWKKTWEKDNEK